VAVQRNTSFRPNAYGFHCVSAMGSVGRYGLSSLPNKKGSSCGQYRLVRQQLDTLEFDGMRVLTNVMVPKKKLAK